MFGDIVPTRVGLVDCAAMLKSAHPVLAELGLTADPNTLLGELGLAERQLIETSRVLIEQSKILILDEPNTAVNEHELERLFNVLRDLRNKGMSMLYVSYRFEEVFAIADRITVMRIGRLAFNRDQADATMADIVQGMVSKSREELFPPRVRSFNGEASSDRTLRVEGLGAGEDLQRISFTARAGEIIGLAGLEGSGMATLLGLLFGTRKATDGRVDFFDGKGLPSTTTAATRRRVSPVPADRRNQGFMLERSVVRNITQASIGAMAGGRAFVKAGAVLDATRRQIQRLRIKERDPEAHAGSLSGGNQQKGRGGALA